jgi:hypothetical protein
MTRYTWEQSCPVSYVDVSSRTNRPDPSLISAAQNIARSFDNSHVLVEVDFLDNEIGIRVASILKNRNDHRMVLAKSDIMIESIKPYLQALQSIEPLDIPFSRYLQPTALLDGAQVDPPEYCRLPGFRWDLKALMTGDIGEPASSSFDPNDLQQVHEARILLGQRSSLDVSQANAVIDVLTQEVSLVQG